VAATGPETLTISGLDSEHIVEVLGQCRVPFSEVAVHRSTLEEAYMELTRDAVDFSAAPTESPVSGNEIAR
jgi:ABC-2 type transport system ATP-binding protein